jgi:long-chain fatty acid transport protein
MRRQVVCVGLALAAALAAPSSARAQGFGLNEIGTCTVGRTSAVTAKPCDDGSAIFWNPAATVGQRGLSIYLGGSAIAVNGSFTQDTSGIRFPGDVPVEYPPAVFANYGWSDRIALGIGAYVPYGLTSQWKEDFPGRFSAQKASLQTIYVQPNIGIDVVPGRFSIGGGPIWAHSTLELRQGIDLSQVPVPLPGVPQGTTFGILGVPGGTEFGRVRAKGSDDAWGFQVGAHAVLTPSWQVGARYLSKVKFAYDADATFEQVNTGLIVPNTNGAFPIPGGTPFDVLLKPQFAAGGAFVAQTARTQIEHPAQAQVGLAFTGLARTTIEADYEWVQWSSFATLPITFTNPASSALSRVLREDYDDANIFRFSADHRFENDFSLRAGFSFNKTPVPDVSVTPLLPDMDRYVFGVGTSIPLASGFSLDASYLRVETEGRRGRIQERTGEAQTAEQLNTGWYGLNANIFSLGLRARFF